MPVISARLPPSIVIVPVLARLLVPSRVTVPGPVSSTLPLPLTMLVPKVDPAEATLLRTTSAPLSTIEGAWMTSPAGPFWASSVAPLAMVTLLAKVEGAAVVAVQLPLCTARVLKPSNPAMVWVDVGAVPEPISVALSVPPPPTMRPVTADPVRRMTASLVASSRTATLFAPLSVPELSSVVAPTAMIAGPLLLDTVPRLTMVLLPPIVSIPANAPETRAPRATVTFTAPGGSISRPVACAEVTVPVIVAVTAPPVPLAIRYTPLASTPVALAEPIRAAIAPLVAIA